MKPGLKVFLAVLGVGAAGGAVYWFFIRRTETSPEELPPGPGPSAVEQYMSLNKDAVPLFSHVAIGPNLYLRKDAGEAFREMAAAAGAVGVDLPVSTAYRSLEWQTQLRKNYEAYLAGGPWAPLAAKPDGNGPHQRGLAVDLNGFDSKKPNYNATRAAWMAANAAKFGWFNTGLTFSMVEPWHFYFKGSPQFPVTTNVA